MRALAALVTFVGLVACAGRSSKLPSGSATMGDEITLYREHAIVTRRIDVVVPEASKATVTFLVPAGVGLEDVAVIERGTLVVSEPRGPSTPEPPPPAIVREDSEADPFDLTDELPIDAEIPTRANAEVAAVTTPTEITFEVTAPKAGRYALSIGYVTDRLAWTAAYTMTTTPARTHASLRGAIAIRNELLVPLPKARVYLVDAEIGAWRGRLVEHLGSALPASAPTLPRYLGELALVAGETRIELLPGDPPRPMRSVLVYDPIGTKLDNSGARPILDASLGAEAAPVRVSESFEIARTRPSSEGLPAGPVRLLERRADGTLALLGEAPLFDVATRVAAVDTIALGTAEGVTGSRERREITFDEDGRRLVEEFVLTITNTRAAPVEVVLREHLYRGQNWTLAYQTGRAPTKEGPQQISLRMIAPARGDAKVMYVVVYTGL